MDYQNQALKVKHKRSPGYIFYKVGIKNPIPFTINHEDLVTAQYGAQPVGSIAVALLMSSIFWFVYS